MSSCRNCNAYFFFFCPYARKVWELIPTHRVVHIATYKNLKDAIKEFRKVIGLPPSGRSGDILPWVCWALWTARNTLIFEDRTFTPDETAAKTLRLAQEWTFAQGLKTHATNQVKILPKAPQLRPDQTARMTCKTNASWNKLSKKA
ncbi:hypothetical protein YC2023_115247 [Brassica napus]